MPAADVPAVVAAPAIDFPAALVTEKFVGSPSSSAFGPSVAGRRQTFVPATPGETHRLAHSGDAAAARRRALASTRALRSSGPASRAATSAPRPARLGAVVRRVTIVTVVAGILATSVLPVLEHSQGAAYAAGNTGAEFTTTSTSGQRVNVSSDITNAEAGRDAYGATSVLDYEQQVIANRKAQANTTYTGPTAADYLANPLYSHTPLDRAAVFQTALQYLGTPYVHGGADPSAFDCSGFIMFVYAQYGISLPHYVPSQDALGTTIPESEAVPGDLVVFNTDDHDGFYAGNGMIMDAPKPGGVITVRPIWSAPHHFVRIGS
ncbi:hypothetical protein GCM10025780_34900 [Frondihabitans cladoniiphilus]|uniref:NlpC/P60 domain-containing protein n=1 Tax=Frondihabitans cladoniiphilus TaxID=715785 RepID=A0ABP8WBK1_9MICO